MEGAAGNGSAKLGWRSPLAILVLLGLVGVVAIAATGRAPARGESSPNGHPPTLIVDYLSTVAVLFVPAGIVLIVWAAFMRRMNRARGTETDKSVPWVRVGITMAILLAVFVYARTHYGAKAAPKTPATADAPGSKTHGKAIGQKHVPADYTPHFQWLLFLVLGSLVVAFVGAAGVLYMRRRRGELPPTPMAVVLAEVLSETLDDLRREPDPRKAVIGAYARMEKTLAARGVPRERFEAPVEYLARVLDLVQVSAYSIRRLTSLFERARFSPHEIDARMKDDAINALSGLRAELEVAT
jgi:NADH:ubiquinone oxidoreductase subunit 6 (subunit J)